MSEAKNSKLWPRYIADGFKDDCLTLLAKFAQTKSASFVDFVQVWQDMKFSMIYCGLNSFAELLEFTEEALNISKQLFLPPNADISRIGALYLLYGVYTQQPTRGLVKVRMTPDDWFQTIDFIANVREYGYADANFIFHFLCYQAAFTFTAVIKEYGLERAYRRHHLAANHVKEMMNCKDISTNQLIKPVFEEIDVDGLEACRKKYEEFKSILTEKEQGQGTEFTSVTPLEDVVSMLQKVVEPLLPDQAGAGTSRQGEGAAAAAAGSSTDIGKGRQGLKQRAFQQKHTGQNHLRSCLPTNEVTEEPSTSSSVPSTSAPGSSVPSTSGQSSGVDVETPEEITVRNEQGLDILRGKVFERGLFRGEFKAKAPKRRKKASSAPSVEDSTSSELVDDPMPFEQADDPTSSELGDDPMSSEQVDDPTPSEQFNDPTSSEKTDEPAPVERADTPDPLAVEDDKSTLRRSKRSAARLKKYHDL